MSTPYADTANKPAVRPASLLSSGPYLALWAASFMSLLAGFFNYVAVAWLALQLTGSTLALGTVLAAASVPQAVLLLVGGAASDRLSPRTVMIGAGAGRAAVMAVVAALALTHSIQLWHLYAAAVLVGSATAFFMPASTSLLPRLVQSELLEAGNGLLNIGRTAAMVLGPAAAGVLVAATNPGTALAADAAAALGSALLAGLLPAGGSLAAGKGNPLRDVREGMVRVWTDVPLRAVLIVISVLNLFALGAIEVGLPALSHLRFSQGAAALGSAFAAWGLGSTAGSIAAGLKPAPARFGPLMLGLTVIIGAGLGAAWLAPALPVLLAILFTLGIVEGGSTTYVMSWLQRRADPELQGRVMSLAILSSVGLEPVALAAAGALATSRLELLFWGSAAAIIVTALLAGLSRSVREA